MSQTCRKNNLAFDVWRHAQKAPLQTALWVNGQNWNYADFAFQASRLAGWFKYRYPAGGAKIGILANRSPEAYIGLLAALWSGNAYVPLNGKLPKPYLQAIVSRSEIECIVIDESTSPKLDEKAFPSNSLTLISPLKSQELKVGQVLVGPDQIEKCSLLAQPVPVSEEQTAYIIFTSGSTGAPKGIAPTVSNVAWFLNATQERYKLTSSDRLSQFNDLPWDPSVFDMFSAWKVGASSHVVPERQLFAPAHFIRAQKLSVWYSGPVQISLLQRMGQLKPACFPSLRLSLFVGEPLLQKAASAWQEAASNSLVENVYGPTETTVVCMGQPFSEAPSCITPERNFVALGTPYHGARVATIDPDRHFLPPGEVGEIVISGPMVTPGYWNDPQLTAESFVHLPESDALWYLTGDLGYQTPEGIFHFLGRKDNQLQVHGVRVEPEEVEYHLRRISGSEEVAVVGWPVKNGLVEGLAAFISPSPLDGKTIREKLARILPSAMVPKKIHVLEHLPRNPNHKIDRKALLRDLEISK